MKTIINLSTFEGITHDTTEIYVKVDNFTKYSGINVVALKNYYVGLNDIAKIDFIIRSSGNHDLIITNSGGSFVQMSLATFKGYCYSNILEFKDATITYRNTESTTILSPIVYETVKTPLVLYRLKCKRNKVNKVINTDLISVGVIYGGFNNVVALRNPVIDVEGFNITETYNYVYVVSLNRFYFVNSVDLVTDKTTRISLSEDVLKSHRDLILLQKGLVTRSEEKGDQLKIVDDRYPLQTVKTVEYPVIAHTTTGSLVNITLNTDFVRTGTGVESRYMVSIVNENAGTLKLNAPSGTLLPTITTANSPRVVNYFLTYENLYDYLVALEGQSNFASFCNSILLLPFNPKTPYALTNPINSMFVGSGEYVLCTDRQIHDIDEPGITTVKVYEYDYNTSPYLILADFTFPSVDKWYEREPYTMYELYVPFVGWVKLDIETVRACRLIVYYTLDYNTGNGTMFIYNYTSGEMIYSTSCQIGIKLPVISTNAQELARERQSIELNTLIGLLASGLSVVAGVVTENPIAVAGGVLSAGKTISSAVNRERMQFERGQITYGSGESGYHGLMSIQLRKTYYKPVLSSSDETNIYNKQQGKPYNNYVALSTLADGYYIEVGDMQFDPKGYDIYNEEINEIVTLLQNGVIL